MPDAVLKYIHVRRASDKTPQKRTKFDEFFKKKSKNFKKQLDKLSHK